MTNVIVNIMAIYRSKYFARFILHFICANLQDLQLYGKNGFAERIKILAEDQKNNLIELSK